MGKAQTVGIIIFIFFAFIIGLFLFSWLGSEDKRKKLMVHYKKLQAEVLDRWRTTFESRNLSKISVENPPYLKASKEFFRDDLYSRRMLKHIQSGFPALWQTMQALRQLEENHNRILSELMSSSAQELDKILKGFSKLMIFQPGMITNYYDPKTMSVLLYVRELKMSNVEVELAPGGLKDWVTRPVAFELRIGEDILAKGDAETIKSLKDSAEGLRSRNASNLETIHQGILESESLLREIVAGTKEILLRLDESNHLAGECDYERSLRS